MVFAMMPALPVHAQSASTTIILDANGGTVSGKVQVTDDNKVAPSVPAAERNGYVFNGWWTSASGGSVLKPGDSAPTSKKTYYAHWTEDTKANARTSTYFYGKAADDSTGSVTYNYGIIDSVNRGFTYNHGVIGTVSENSSSGTYNYGRIGTYASNNSSGLGSNYGVIGRNTGTVNRNYGIIENNTGTVSQTYSNSVTYNRGGTVNDAQYGTIYNYSGIVNQYWASNGAKVYNFSGGTFVYDSSSGGTTIYDLGGKVSGTPGRSDKLVTCYAVNFGTGLVKSVSGDFIEDENGTAWLPEDGEGTITPADGVTALYTTNGTLTKNDNGTYTLSHITKDTAISDMPSYAITYDLDGGELADGDKNPTSYTERDTFTLKNPKDKANGEYVEYIFDGWIGTELDQPAKEVTIPAGSTGDRSYKAVWKPNPDLINVTFKYDEDSKGIVKKYDKEKAGTAFGNLLDDTKLSSYAEKTGYDFVGWYTAPEGGEKITADTARPGEDTTYYARWKIRTVTITLDGTGGTNGRSCSGEYKTKIGVLPVSTRSGYFFNGWWSKNSRGEWGDPINARTGFPVNDTTYYARWTKKTEENTSTFINGAFGFDGYFDAADEDRGNITRNYGDIELVTSNGSVGDNYGRIGIYKGTSGISNNYGLIENNKGRLDYNYNIVQENSGTTEYNEGLMKLNTGTVDTNRGTLDTNRGTVKSNRGTVEVNDENGTVDVNYGEVGFNKGVVNTNYGTVRNFGGTVKDDRNGSVSDFYKITAGSRVAEITYQDGFTAFDDGQWLQEASGSGTIKVKLTDDARDEAFLVTADGCSIEKNEDGSYTLRNVTRNVIISAVPTVFNISYDLDGGTAENRTSYTYDDEGFTLHNPVRAGFTFIGWSGTDLQGGDNMSVTVPKNSWGDRSYAAHWNKITYTISYDYAGGKVNGQNPSSYDVESPSFTLKTPKREGYVFTGWVGTGLAENTKTVTVKTGTTGNLHYKATWKRPVELLTVKAKGRTGQVLTWNKVSAFKYVVYRTSCRGEKSNFKKIATVKGSSLTVKGLKENTAYKYYVKAIDAKGKTVVKSAMVHSATGNVYGKYTNAKSVSAKVGKKTLKRGESTKLTMKTAPAVKGMRVLWKGHTDQYRFAITDANYPSASSGAVKVSRNGKVKAVSKGKARIYIMAANGVRTLVTITVK